MKSKIPVAAFAVLFFISCNSPGNKTTEPVKTDTVNTTIDTAKGPSDALLRNVPENVRKIKEEYYNITVDAAGAPESVNTGTVYLAVYDKKGNILEEGYYNSDSSYFWKWTFQYDGRGNKINSNEYHAKEKLAFKGFFSYDTKNNLVLESYYLPDGRLSYSITDKYDNRKNKIESIIKTAVVVAGGRGARRNEYASDDKHHIISNECYGSDEKIAFIDKYKFDSAGNPTENIYTDPDNNTSTSTFYKYEYDEKGNWIRKTEFKKYDSVEKSLKSTIRYIEYY